jgi:hypothetical protein
MAGFPATGEDARRGGADIARVGAPQAPRFSIRDVVRRFDVDDAARAADGIPNAVKLDDTTQTFAFDRPLCLPDDWDGKEAEPAADYWDFHASGCYVPVGCDRNAHAFDRWWQRARAKVEAASPKRLAQRLWFDSVAAGTGYANPSLMSVGAQTGHDLSNADAAMSPKAAVATLVQGYFDATDTPGDAVLHVPPIVAVSLIADGALKEISGKLYGPLDVAVSCGPYPSQVGLDGADIDDVSLTYVAISGPIYAEEGSTFSADGTTSAPAYMGNERRNEFGVIAERRFIFAFDPGPVYAAQCYVPNIPQEA